MFFTTMWVRVLEIIQVCFLSGAVFEKGFLLLGLVNDLKVPRISKCLMHEYNDYIDDSFSDNQVQDSRYYINMVEERK